MRAQAPGGTELPGLHEQSLDLLVAEDVGAWPLPSSAEQTIRGNLMARFFGVHEPGKANHHPQPVFALGLADADPGPVDRGPRHHESITMCRCIGDEAAQIGLVGLELKAHTAPHGQVGLERCHQHDVASGQGLAISRSSCTSTLA